MKRTKVGKMKIDPNQIRTRDEAMVRLINGATKAGVHVDRKKEENRRRCRKKIPRDDY